MHTHEILDELKDKHVESISEELSAWAETSDMEIARLKETEKFRKEYLGNVAHELKTPIFNIQGIFRRCSTADWKTNSSTASISNVRKRASTG